MATKQRLNRYSDYWCADIQGGRDYQEDYSGFDDRHPNILLMLLADGMGGHIGGDQASKLAVETFAYTYTYTPSKDKEYTIQEVLSYALNSANQSLAQKIKKEPELQGMGCTFVGAEFRQDSGQLNWVSVGDSPMWLIRDEKLIRLNKDHSKRCELDAQVQRGEISVQDALAHPERNALLSALTGMPPPLIEYKSMTLKSHDTLLIASDGLFTLSNMEISTIISLHPNNAKKQVETLLQAVKRKNKPQQDNTTALVLNIPAEEQPQTIAIDHSIVGRNKYFFYSIGFILMLVALVASFLMGTHLSGSINNTEGKLTSVNNTLFLTPTPESLQKEKQKIKEEKTEEKKKESQYVKPKIIEPSPKKTSKTKPEKQEVEPRIVKPRSIPSQPSERTSEKKRTKPVAKTNIDTPSSQKVESTKAEKSRGLPTSLPTPRETLPEAATSVVPQQNELQKPSQPSVIATTPASNVPTHPVSPPQTVPEEESLHEKIQDEKAQGGVIQDAEIPKKDNADTCLENEDFCYD